MAEFRARITNDFVLSELDKATKHSDNLSKSQLINEILEMYFTSRKDFFLRALPPIIECMCDETLRKQEENNNELMRLNTNILVKVLNSIDELRSIFIEELKNDE